MNDSQKDYVFKIAELFQHFNSLSVDVRLWIGCQFALESNFGSSSLALGYNNHSGMKCAEIRLNTNTNVVRKGSDFAWYRNLKFCVLDYVLWLQYNKIPRNAQCRVSDFALFIESRNYCPEKDYISRVFSLYNQLKS